MGTNGKKNVNEVDGVPVATFDLDGWIDGTTNMTRMAKIVQRGDLLAEVDRLQAKLDVARRIPEQDRGVDDEDLDPEALEAQLEQVYEQIWSTMIYAYVQDRTEDRREAIRKRLKKQGVSAADQSIAVIADAIVKIETTDGRVLEMGPDGFPPEKLRKIRDNGGDAATHDLVRVFTEVTAKAPAIRAPLSRRSSTNDAGTT